MNHRELKVQKGDLRKSQIHLNDSSSSGADNSGD